MDFQKHYVAKKMLLGQWVNAGDGKNRFAQYQGTTEAE